MFYYFDNILKGMFSSQLEENWIPFVLSYGHETLVAKALFSVADGAGGDKPCTSQELSFAKTA